LRVEKQQAIPREWLYGRRDDVGKTMRLDSADIVPTDCLGEFSLYPVQGKVYSVFVPLKRLQKELDQPERVNTVLWRAQSKSAESILASLEKRLSLQDLDLKLRFTPARKAFSLESGRILLDDSIARAAAQSAARPEWPFRLCTATLPIPYGQIPARFPIRSLQPRIWKRAP